MIHVDVPASKLHPLALGNSAAVQPGQSVVAIGSPFGLPETMTAGIVSATNRTITAPNQFSITGAIQTDAAINHGNSGGPLIDTATNTVIGVNDQIESDTNDNSGVGFAVPINSSKAAAQTLIAGGKVQHAYVGVRIQERRPAAPRSRQIVAGAPRPRRPGSRSATSITSFDGKTIGSADDLTAAVFHAKPGEKVSVTDHPQRQRRSTSPSRSASSPRTLLLTSCAAAGGPTAAARRDSSSVGSLPWTA